MANPEKNQQNLAEQTTITARLSDLTTPYRQLQTLASPLALDPDPYTVLYQIYHSTQHQNLPTPVAFIGDWHSYKAIVLPSILLEENLPIQPGWVGYYSYPDRLDEARLPAIIGGIYNGALVQDSTHHWWWFSSSDNLAHPLEQNTSQNCTRRDPPAWIENLPLVSYPTESPISWSSPAQDAHAQMISACHTAIRQGEVYQVNLCSAFTGITEASPIEIFCQIGSQVQAQKSVFLTGNWGTIASFSPETFVKSSGQKISMSPIKGTLANTADPQKLHDSIKDRAENIMIVDVVRNDMSKIVEHFTLAVPELCTVTAAPGVWNMVSTVTGQLQPTLTHTDILAALYPIASVTGAPKIRACELIAEWEKQARGIYCGFAGLVLTNGNMDLSVLIRSLEIATDNSIILGVGGGITIDSTPDAEYQEILAKAQAIISASTHPRG